VQPPGPLNRSIAGIEQGLRSLEQLDRSANLKQVGQLLKRLWRFAADPQRALALAKEVFACSLALDESLPQPAIHRIQAGGDRQQLAEVERDVDYVLERADQSLHRAIALVELASSYLRLKRDAVRAAEVAQWAHRESGRPVVMMAAELYSWVAGRADLPSTASRISRGIARVRGKYPSGYLSQLGRVLTRSAQWLHQEGWITADDRARLIAGVMRG
jgi:hypothetical protein